MTETEGRPDPSEDEQADGQRVTITPTLVVLGLVAVALGVFSALVMSASTFGR